MKTGCKNAASLVTRRRREGVVNFTIHSLYTGSAVEGNGGKEKGRNGQAPELVAKRQEISLLFQRNMVVSLKSFNVKQI